MRGEEVAHTIDPETGKVVAQILVVNIQQHLKIYLVAIAKAMASDEYVDEIKQYFYLLNYNMSVPVAGQRHVH